MTTWVSDWRRRRALGTDSRYGPPTGTGSWCAPPMQPLPPESEGRGTITRGGQGRSADEVRSAAIVFGIVCGLSGLLVGVLSTYVIFGG